MNFVSTGVKEVTRRLLRQRNRLALSNARKFVERSEIALGRLCWRQLADDPSVRPAYEHLLALDAEVAAIQQQVAEIEAKVHAREAAREEARAAHQAATSAIEDAKRPLEEIAAKAQIRLGEIAAELHEQGARIAACRAEQSALAKEQKRFGRRLPADEREQSRLQLEAQHAALSEQVTSLDAARSALLTPQAAEESELRRARAELSVLDQQIKDARDALSAEERAAAIAIAGLHKEIAATRRQAARIESQKEASYLTIGRRLAEHPDAAPAPGSDEEELRKVAQRHRLSYERLLSLDAGWMRESQNANQQDLRIFNFVSVTLAALVAVAFLLVLRTPAKRDWLPSNTEAIVSLNVGRFTNADFTHALETQEPDAWKEVWTGLVQKLADVPQINVREQVARITHALAPSGAKDGAPVDYLLVEMRSSVNVDEFVREELMRKGGFERRSVEGLYIYEKPGIVAVAQIGPDTLALGTTSAVETLIGVRLGIKEDLKSDAQFFSEFSRLDDDSAFRLVTYHPQQLTYLTDPLLSRQLLTDCQALGLTINLGEPASAVFVLNTNNTAAADRIAHLLDSKPDQVLQLQSAGPNLFIEPPSVRIYDNQVEWRFKMTAPAAREFLMRVSRLGLPNNGSAVAESAP